MLDFIGWVFSIFQAPRLGSISGTSWDSRFVFVCWCWLVCWSWVVSWSWFVCWGWFIGWLVVGRSGFVCRCRVVGRSWLVSRGRGVGWCWVVARSMWGMATVCNGSVATMTYADMRAAIGFSFCQAL